MQSDFCRVSGAKLYYGALVPAAAPAVPVALILYDDELTGCKTFTVNSISLKMILRP